MVDTLKDIDGIWFSGDAQWRPIDELVTDGTLEGKTVNGTAGDDYIVGTAGDDTLNGNGGSDVFFDSNGDDEIFGNEGSYDQVNYEGSKGDFLFSTNTDGSVSAKSDHTGTDMLHDIDGIWFEDEGAWYSLDDLV